MAGGKPVAPATWRVTTIRRITTGADNVKPFVLPHPRGGAYLAWAQKDGERTAAYFARSADGIRFEAPVRLSPEGMDLDLGAENGPHVAAGPNGDLFVVWAAGSRAAARPRPAGHGGHRGHPSRPGNLNIYLVRSTDDGRTFSAPRRGNDDPDGPEHRFPTVTVDRRGTVYVAWLDKRQETKERPGFSRAYLARSTDGGRTFAPNVDVTAGQESPICHCCKLALATHPAEGVFVAFRNDVNDLRDIFLVRAPQDGGPFSPPVPIEATRWMVPT
jgi:hypothetical protein